MQPIAIIGASCRFPGANGLEEFWQLLREGRNAVTTVPKDRWDAEALVDQNPESRANIATQHGGFIRNVRDFDCPFFGVSPREAAAMDPQQRLLLETAYEAFEDAGLPMESLAGSQTAVYVGIGPGDYGRMGAQPWEGISAYYVTGNFLSTAVDRLAYFFDLRGPSMAIDTACSSSLVSLHLACRSLESGEADLALAGGVNALLAPTLSISLAKAGALSPTGRCRSFDAQADGYVRGEGSGFVVLKNLDKALADGDRIYAVVRGTAVRQGGRRNGLTAPGGWGQEAVMKAAWQESGIAPAQADYVEAQATGTLLGDAIEGNAIGKIFGPRKGSGLCRIGSVKTNIGHLETAAGVAGLIKVALMIYHGEFVPSLYPEQPNPHINLAKLGLAMQMRSESWPVTSASGRTAGVSSFGMGGTYAHVCMTSAGTSPAISDEGENDARFPGFLIPLSARHPDALHELVSQTAALIEEADEACVFDLCRAAAIRRTQHDYRIAFAALSVPELLKAMNSWLQQSKQAAKASGKRKLVVLSSATDDGTAEFAQLDHCVQLLEKWGVSPVQILRLVNGRVLAQIARESASDSQRDEVGLEELRSSGIDILDLTREKFLARPGASSAKGTVVFGFSSSEPALLTPIRVAADLYTLGYPLAWRQIHPGTVKQVALATYPWQHQECWLESLNTRIAPTSKPAVHTNRSVLPSNGNLLTVLARITGLPAKDIRPEASPADLGIDSLLTLELQEELQRMSGVLVPVETLVQVQNVRDLETVLQEQGENSSVLTESAPSRPAIVPGRSTEIREARIGEYEKIAAVILRSGLGVKPQAEWEHIWTNNPVCRKHPNWPIGWVVQDGTEIVGFLGNIPLSYHLRGREILASGLHAFALDPSHRGLGLLLLNRLLEFAPEVEYFVGSSANPNSSAVLDRMGVSRIPLGDWENSAFWITNYDGFVGSAISKKGLPDLLATPGAVALKMYDKVSKKAWPRQEHELHKQERFDERFDVFWQALQAAYPDRLLATRSREHLDWHFNCSVLQNRTWVVTHEVDSRIVASAIFQRQDYREINLKRVRLIDYQSLSDSPSVLASMLAWGLDECRSQGIHMLEAFGFRPEKQQVIDRLAPHRRRLGAWTYFHKVASPALQRELQDPNVWDPSLFDGDASL